MCSANGAFSILAKHRAPIVDPPGDVAPDRVFVINVWRDRPRPEASLTRTIYVRPAGSR